MDGPSREEFNRLYETLDRGFTGIHNRMDVQNGRVGKAEVAQENIRTRLTSVEKELFRTPQRRRADAEIAVAASPFFTKREKALIALGIATISALLKVTMLAGEAAFEAVKMVVMKGMH